MSADPTETVVTGRGACSPAGPDVHSLWRGLCEKRACIRDIEHFDTSTASLHRAGFVPGPDERPDSPGRTLELAVRAARQAVREAAPPPSHRTAVVLGSTEPTTTDGGTQGLFPGLLASRCAEALSVTGEAVTVASASASGALGISMGRDMLRAGDADTVLAGGADAVTETAFLGLNSLRTLSPHGCRPFTRDRRGIGVSEGAGLLHLERRDSAEARGARVHAVLAGAGVTNMTDHLATPRATGVRVAVERALVDAGMDPDEVDLVNAHGPGTRQGDRVEIEALREVFGARTAEIPVVSSKSVLWHLQGAAGAIEALICVLCLERDAITPTRITGALDPAYADLDLVDHDGARPAPRLRAALSVSCGLGGLNVALLFRSA
ncbi:beta-ketoacyl-[acyl-carrier-protein] synthase family protein [Marinactinospora endophytica]